MNGAAPGFADVARIVGGGSTDPDEPALPALSVRPSYID